MGPTFAIDTNGNVFLQFVVIGLTKFIFYIEVSIDIEELITSVSSHGEYR